MRRRIGCWLVVVTACHASAVSPRDDHNTSVAMAATGVDSASLDPTVDPCVDFYQYACGGWLAKTTIPPGYAGYARASEADDRTRQELQTLLTMPVSRPDDPSRPLVDYFASCMDIAATDRAGITPIKPLLATTMGVKDATTWQTAIIAMHELGFSAVWNVNVGPDIKDATTNVLYMDAGGLELPNRDYYEDPKLADKLEAYRQHAGKMLVLAGMSAATAKRGADDIVQIETAIAKRMKTAVEARDPAAAYHAFDGHWLASQARTINWSAYWSKLGVTSPGKIIVGTPAFFTGLEALRSQFTWTQWASYFTYHAMSSQSFSLGTAVDDEDFELQKTLFGTTEQAPRGPRCTEETKQALGDLLGKRYVAQYLSPSTKHTATRYAEAIAAALGQDIRQLDWMSSSTKSFALTKLERMAKLVGYPETWKDYDFAIARDDFAGNELRRFAFAARRDLHRAGMPVARGQWLVNVVKTDMYFDSATNSMVMPAAILQPPFFDPTRSLAVNLGALGALIGHEMTHAFDDQGAKFDEHGDLRDWWQPTDRAQFETKQKCLVDRYAKFEALPGRFVNGQLTLGENIADVGGLKAAYRAYLELRRASPHDEPHGSVPPEQQFFLGFAQARCTKASVAWSERALVSDTHAPAKFRVNGPVADLPAFAEAFHCPVRAPMNPSSRCEIW